MGERQKPTTQRETIEQLWYTIVGTNGEGMVEHVKELRQDVREIKETMVTREKCSAIRANVKRKKWRKQDVFLMAWGAFGTVASAVIAFFAFVSGG